MTTPVALVTGGSRGIGKAIVQALARAGYAVVINYRRSADEAQRLAEQITADAGTAYTIAADISSRDDREKLVAYLNSTTGRIDLLVNNAGQAPRVRADILEAAPDSFDHIIATNLKGPYFLTQAVANWMIDLKQDLAEYTPKIIFVTSVSAETVSVNRGDYCISKAGLSMAAKLFAARLAHDDIPVYEIRPGIIETDMTAAVTGKYDALIAGGLVPQHRWGRPDDVAKVVQAVATDLLPFSTGAVIPVDGGLAVPRL